MEKTLETTMTSREALQIKAAIAKCDTALRQTFRRMKKDQVEIDKLRVHTRKILAEMKAL
jgi:hypothetical protein